jgi:hypothetical protein
MQCNATVGPINHNSEFKIYSNKINSYVDTNSFKKYINNSFKNYRRINDNKKEFISITDNLTVNIKVSDVETNAMYLDNVTDILHTVYNNIKKDDDPELVLDSEKSDRDIRDESLHLANCSTEESIQKANTSCENIIKNTQLDDSTILKLVINAIQYINKVKKNLESGITTNTSSQEKFIQENEITSLSKKVDTRNPLPKYNYLKPENERRSSKYPHKEIIKCYCCEDEIYYNESEISHNIAHSLGGSYGHNNCYLCCKDCNRTMSQSSIDIIKPLILEDRIQKNITPKVIFE